MIPAAPSPGFRRLFAAHCRSRMRATFSAVRVDGLERLRQALDLGPTLVVSNHGSWWDPLVALLLTDQLQADGRALMDGRNLARLPFFRLLGAFGVDLEDPRDGALALRYASRHLAGPGCLVWVFPQGRERHEDPRPLGFLPGAAAIARLARGCRVVPVAIRPAFVGAERPELLIAVGAPLDPSRAIEAGRQAQEAAVQAELDRLERWLADPELRAGQPVLLEAPPRRLGKLAEGLLAWIVGRLLGAPPPASLPAPGEGPAPARRSAD